MATKHGSGWQSRWMRSLQTASSGAGGPEHPAAIAAPNVPTSHARIGAALSGPR